MDTIKNKDERNWIVEYSSSSWKDNYHFTKSFYFHQIRQMKIITKLHTGNIFNMIIYFFIINNNNNQLIFKVLVLTIVVVLSRHCRKAVLNKC